MSAFKHAVEAVPRIVIVGAGQAGARAAFALRNEGWKGAITLLGDEMHIPYERPSLSKRALLNGIDDSMDVAAMERYPEADIELLTGTSAVSLDTQAKTLQIRKDHGLLEALKYEQLLLATGGRARTIKITGEEHVPLLTLRTKDDAGRLAAQLMPGSRLVVIGGGFTGLEIAASARQKGCEVQVLESAPRLLGRNVPENLAALIHALHRRHRVGISLLDSPVEIRRDANQVMICCASGQVVVADVVVSCVGMTPNIDLAKEAGLQVNRGVLVNQFLQTSAPGVYAIGDVCEMQDEEGRPIVRESWDNAESQARQVAQNMQGAAQRYDPLPWFWSDQFDHTLQMVGIQSGYFTCVGRELDGGRLDFYLDAAARVMGAAGFAPTPVLSKPFLIAKKLVEAKACCDPDQLGDASFPLKQFLRQ